MSSIGKKLADLAEKVICGPDDGQAAAEDLRKAQEEARKQEGK